MKKIKNKNDLLEEKLRLQTEVNAAEEILKEDLEWLKEEITPGKITAKFFSNLLGKNTNSILNKGVSSTIDAFLKNILLSKSGWLTRFVVPLIVKNLSSNYIADNKPEIFGVLRNLIKKTRKSLKHDDDNHYDKSTVEDFNYE